MMTGVFALTVLPVSVVCVELRRYDSVSLAQLGMSTGELRSEASVSFALLLGMLVSEFCWDASVSLAVPGLSVSEER